MTTAAAVVAEEPRLHYLNESYGVRSWLLTTDHKRVGLLYLISLTGAFFVGGFFAVMLRLELLTPAGDLLQAETYNKFFTMHGVIMVFFFLVPSIPAVLGNFVLPLMIGARDVAFPRLNLLSWYLYVLGASFTTYAVVTGGVDTGWTFYTPYSTMSSTTQVMPTAIGIFIVGFSSILTGLNFIVTIHRMRAPGLTWFRLPLFVWSLYATSLIQILATPVLAITVMLPGRDPLRREGVQLDRDAAQGDDRVPHPAALRARLHRAVHHRRPDRPLPRLARHGRARDRHLLRDRPLPLHHGGRHGHGLHGRRALLVAEDQRADVPRGLGAARGAHHLHRLQPDLLPAVHPRLPRHAAALPRLSRGVPSAERDVDGRRVHPGRRLPAADDLPPLVAALRRERGRQPVGRDRPRVADAVAAAARQLRNRPGGHRRALRLPGPRAGPWLSTPPRAPSCTTTQHT